jgi:5-methylcytosine-specific restriction endonuclease McrA
MSRYIPKQKKQQIKEEADWQCRHCDYEAEEGVSEGELVVDHIISYNDCFFSGDFNLQSLCWGCNREKSNDDPEIRDMFQPEDEFGEPELRINLADKIKLGGLVKDTGFGGLPKFRLW